MEDFDIHHDMELLTPETFIMINRPNPMPDTTLRNSLQWVHTMPQGQGTLVNGGPVVEYQTRPVTERTSGTPTTVVEWLYADIRAAHLDTGNEPNNTIRQWVQNEVGLSSDHAGHIVANRLGGSGRVKWNIFPQNANLNSGVNRSDIEDMIYTEVRLTGNVKVWYHFVYDNPTYPGRPSMFQFYFGHTSRVGALLGDQGNDLLNPVSLAAARSSR